MGRPRHPILLPRALSAANHAVLRHHAADRQRAAHARREPPSTGDRLPSRAGRGAGGHRQARLPHSRPPGAGDEDAALGVPRLHDDDPERAAEGEARHRRGEGAAGGAAAFGDCEEGVL